MSITALIPAELLVAYDSVRRTSDRICEPLITEDYVIQSMPDVSPPKWHLAHTTWFFERVILQEFAKAYRPYNEQYYHLFNSYYNSFGERWQRDIRGTLSRPSVKEVFDYRSAIDARIHSLLDSISKTDFSRVSELLILGLNHEQQHQELLITDIKHILASNPLRPAYRPHRRTGSAPGSATKPARFVGVEGGMFEMGAPDGPFAWDNELPRHRTFVNDFSLMDRLVTCGEYLEFMADRGYENPLLWLSDGWEAVTAGRWTSPLYWSQIDGEWKIATLAGVRKIEPEEPVSHVSHYEASAYARWASRRLPTEVEWERASALLDNSTLNANLLEDENYHPVPVRPTGNTHPSGLQQMLGDLWEWTNSAYLPYPGYRQYRGPLGEYNGKFMINQMVLRGGSCATPRTHIRTSYRNFFPCDKRWQFTGIRLASDPD